MKHHGEKFLGNYTYLDLYDLMSQVPSFPADVWRQVEMKTIETLAFVERAEVTDPEGTAFGYDLKESEAQAWAAGVYQQGHLYMFPAQATGRFPYSLVEYPVMTSKYVPGVLPEVSGIIASTTSHAATHPRMEITVKNGKISEIKGGGLYGRLPASPAIGGSMKRAWARIRNISNIRSKCSKASICRSAMLQA